MRIVLTGDSNEINEPTFVERIGGSLDCDVLKVGHHGSETSSTEEFLDAINCEYAVISCNADGNTFYHPRQNTLDRFIADDMTIYRTDNNGNIVLTVDENGEMKFTLEREADQSTAGRTRRSPQKAERPLPGQTKPNEKTAFPSGFSFLYLKLFGGKYKSRRGILIPLLPGDPTHQPHHKIKDFATGSPLYISGSPGKNL